VINADLESGQPISSSDQLKARSYAKLLKDCDFSMDDYHAYYLEIQMDKLADAWKKQSFDEKYGLHDVSFS